ncbi:MAG: C-type lectin domain-containing protein [Labilithrix sp.]|nr:C-type lectin domain-containing protein [Labilithrix sp.]MCW5814947.1 C-type lectin domain-containing protein [Labilithrix sp.]
MAAVCAAATACGLDLVGTAVFEAPGSGDDASVVVDAFVPDAPAAPGADADADAVHAADAASPLAPCEGDAAIVAFGRCYLRLREQRSQPEQRLACEDAGMHLVTIRSAEENAFVADAGGGVDQWIGFVAPPERVNDPDGFGWLSKDPVTFIAWRPPDPNGGHQCARMYPNEPFDWGDLTCTAPLAALCERDR